MAQTLFRLERVIAARRSAPASGSYVASLHAKGLRRIVQKLGEEAVETVIAAMGDDRVALAGEAADLLFHLMVLLDAKGIAFGDVLAALERREGLSGLEEKAARSDPPPAAPEPTGAASAEEPAPPAEPLLTLGRDDDAVPATRPRIRKG